MSTLMSKVKIATYVEGPGKRWLRRPRKIIDEKSMWHLSLSLSIQTIRSFHWVLVYFVFVSFFFRKHTLVRYTRTFNGLSWTYQPVEFVPKSALPSSYGGLFDYLWRRSSLATLEDLTNSWAPKLISVIFFGWASNIQLRPIQEPMSLANYGCG